MNTNKSHEDRPERGTERDERYATGNTGSEKRSGTTHGGYREWSDNWNETKAKLQRNYSQLTDNDLRLESGKEDELIGRISQKLGRTPEDTRKLLQDTSGKMNEPRKGQEPGANTRAEDRSSSAHHQEDRNKK
ncbi:MAG: hypothetical protein QM724_12300 [Flavobacteriales bacterium]